MKRTLLFVGGMAAHRPGARRSSRSRFQRSTTTPMPASSRFRPTVKWPAWRRTPVVTSSSTRGPVTPSPPSATSAPSITAARACFSSIRSGKFVKEIGQGVYAVNFAQQVRVDPQDNIWIVDAGSNQVVKFDAEGRFRWCSAESRRASPCDPALACRPRRLTRRLSPRAAPRRAGLVAEVVVAAEAPPAGHPEPESTATTSIGRQM